MRRVGIGRSVINGGSGTNIGFSGEGWNNASSEEECLGYIQHLIRCQMEMPRTG